MEALKEEAAKDEKLSQEKSGQEAHMIQTNPVSFEVRLGAMDLWRFSMYHSNRGMQGLFNVLFSGAAIFLLITTWKTDTAAYRALLAVCALLFTVWQPAVLYAKAAKQAKNPAIRNPMHLSFSREGIVVEQKGERLELVWEQIAGVESIGSMVIVYMDKVHAYLLPDSITGDKKEGLLALVGELLPKERRNKRI